MKNIIFFDNYAYSTFHFRKDVLLELSKIYKIYVIAPSDPNFIKDSIFSNITYIDINFNRTSKNIFKDFYLLFKIFFIFKNIKPCLVINFTLKPVLYGSLISKILNIKIVNILAGLNNAFFNGNKFYKFIFKIFTFSSNYFVTLNISDYEFLINYNYINKNKIIFFDCGEGVNTKFYKPSKNKYNFDHNIKRFVFVSRILKSKGVIEFLEAAKYISSNFSNVEFWVCGEFDKHHPDSLNVIEFNKYFNSNSIKYLGRVSNINYILNQCYFFILPSYYNEGLNRSLMEAISCGLPVITTNNKGCKELLIDNSNGFLINKKDTNDLITAIEKSLNLDTTLYNKMCTESRNLALNKFDTSIVIDLYKKLLLNLI
jgi:glycosyltransferase involved in cell wall biosynthesis